MRKFHKHRLVLNQGSVGIRSSTLFSCSFLAGVFWFEWTCLANSSSINWGIGLGCMQGWRNQHPVFLGQRLLMRG